MVRNKFSWLIYLIIGLAAIGLISQLFTDPANFIMGIFITIGIGIALFAVLYFVFLRKRAPSSEMKKYKQAVRQSKSKYNSSPKHTQVKQSPKMRKKATKRASHLRVIDGNKHKRKNRASF